MKKRIHFLKKLMAWLYPANPFSSQPVFTKPPAPRVTTEKKPPTGNSLTEEVEQHLRDTYEFRFNQMTDSTEYRQRNNTNPIFHPVGTRELNTLCLEAHKQGVNCWDRDISRYINSLSIPNHHPFSHFLHTLPAWDGQERVTELARRVSEDPLWVNGFHRWMRGLVAQWMNKDPLHANSLAPVLVSRRQEMHKSTFCKMLLPATLQRYYTDSFELNAGSAAERKLSAFGLINLDEFDKFSPSQMALLKNLMQMAGLTIRKAYQKNYTPLPRIASFIATSNQMELLTDPTGSRRFLCVEIHQKIDCSPIDYGQLYAQLKTEILADAPYFFTEEEELQLMKNNSPFRRRGMEEDIFFTCYRFPKPGEPHQLLSAAQIFGQLKRTHPAAMRNVPPSRFPQTLTALQVERVHTRTGNRYKVVSLSA